MLGRWSHAFARSRTTLQVYFDRASNNATSLLDDRMDIYDVDFQHDISISKTHNWIWGVNFRAMNDDALAGRYVGLSPDNRDWKSFSTFAQDEFTLFQDRLRVTLGSKVEHNAFTGFEVEPNGRLLVNLSENQSLWGAVSRAVRTPARTEQDMRLDAVVLPPSAQSAGLPVRVTRSWRPAVRRREPAGLRDRLSRRPRSCVGRPRGVL